MSHIRCVAIQVSVSPSLMSTSRLTGGPREGLVQGCKLKDMHHEVPDAHPGLSDSRLLELAESQQQVAWSEKQAEAEQ